MSISELNNRIVSNQQTIEKYGTFLNAIASLGDFVSLVGCIENASNLMENVIVGGKGLVVDEISSLSTQINRCINDLNDIVIELQNRINILNEDINYCEREINRLRKLAENRKKKEEAVNEEDVKNGQYKYR